MVHRYLDVRRLLCPMPILKAEAALRDMVTGEILEMRATDPGLTRDLPAWCRMQGHQLLALHQHGREWIGYVAKGCS